MHKLMKYLALVIFFTFVAMCTYSCKTKEGCGPEEKADLETTKRGTSTLFPKSMTKKKKKKS